MEFQHSYDLMCITVFGVFNTELKLDFVQAKLQEL